MANVSARTFLILSTTKAATILISIRGLFDNPSVADRMFNPGPSIFLVQTTTIQAQRNDISYRRASLFQDWSHKHCHFPRSRMRANRTTSISKDDPGRSGAEFISRDLDLWAYVDEVTLDFSRTGKPSDNGVIEAFNSKYRTECLSAHCFLVLADAREKMDDWRQTLQ